MKKILQKIKYLKLSDILSPIIFILVLPLATIYRIYLRLTNKKLWLICEDGYTARDNGYHFFKYMMDKHPEYITYYVIKKQEPDYQKIKQYDKNIIEFKSLKHWIYYMSASENISIHKHGNPCRSFWYVMHVVLKLYNNRVFLQHGVIKDDLPFVHYKNARFKIFICSAKREYEFVKKTFGYPEGVVQNTGLARFDNLHNLKINNKQILFMPTWRSWFGGTTKFDHNKEAFRNTDFFKYWSALMNDNKLISYIEKNNITIYFYPHQHMQKFLHTFKTNSNNIKIINNSNIDIQKLLKESPLLVTDYSSVFMDFAYMNKPVLYYQFDEEEFRQKHLPIGYFDYKKDGFGKILTTKDELVSNIINLIDNNYIDETKYTNRRKNFFEKRDQNNCLRIFLAIEKSEVKK